MKAFLSRRAASRTHLAIGMGTQSISELGGLLANPEIQIIAVYRHDTSRELDPQLHTHAVAANLTL